MKHLFTFFNPSSYLSAKFKLSDRFPLNSVLNCIKPYRNSLILLSTILKANVLKGLREFYVYLSQIMTKLYTRHLTPHVIALDLYEKYQHNFHLL